MRCCALCVFLIFTVALAEVPPKMQVVSNCAIAVAEIAGLLSNCPALSPRYYRGNFPPWFQYTGCIGAGIGTFFQINICIGDIVNYFGINTPAARPYRSTPQNPSDLLDALEQALEDPALRRELKQILEAALNKTSD